jgi:hypothetical protein
VVKSTDLAMQFMFSLAYIMASEILHKDKTLTQGCSDVTCIATVRRAASTTITAASIRRVTRLNDKAFGARDLNSGSTWFESRENDQVVLSPSRLIPA